MKKSFIFLVFIIIFSCNSSPKTQVTQNKPELDLAFMPLFKSDKIESDVKDHLRDEVFNSLDQKSFRELTEEANSLKVTYGLSKPKADTKKPSATLSSTLISIHPSIKKFSSNSADASYLMIVEILQSRGFLTEKELNVIANDFEQITKA